MLSFDILLDLGRYKLQASSAFGGFQLQPCSFRPFRFLGRPPACLYRPFAYQSTKSCEPLSMRLLAPKLNSVAPSWIFPRGFPNSQPTNSKMQCSENAWPVGQWTARFIFRWPFSQCMLPKIVNTSCAQLFDRHSAFESRPDRLKHRWPSLSSISSADLFLGQLN